MKYIILFVVISATLICGCVEQCRYDKTPIGKITDYRVHQIGGYNANCTVFVGNFSAYVDDSIACKNADYGNTLVKIDSPNCFENYEMKTHTWYEIEVKHASLF
jgi:hypothetical protein